MSTLILLCIILPVGVFVIKYIIYTLSGYYYSRGLKKNKLGKNESALSDLDKAIKLNSNYFDAYCLRGIIKDKLGMYKEAKSDVDKLIQLNPKHINAYHWRGNLNLKLGMYEESISDLDTSSELGASHLCNECKYL